jgi:hypothetical protein
MSCALLPRLFLWLETRVYGYVIGSAAICRACMIVAPLTDRSVN